MSKYKRSSIIITPVLGAPITIDNYVALSTMDSKESQYEISTFSNGIKIVPRDSVKNLISIQGILPSAPLKKNQSMTNEIWEEQFVENYKNKFRASALLRNNASFVLKLLDRQITGYPVSLATTYKANLPYVEYTMGIFVTSDTTIDNKLQSDKDNPDIIDNMMMVEGKRKDIGSTFSVKGDNNTKSNNSKDENTDKENTIVIKSCVEQRGEKYIVTENQKTIVAMGANATVWNIEIAVPEVASSEGGATCKSFEDFYDKYYINGNTPREIIINRIGGNQTIQGFMIKRTRVFMGHNGVGHYTLVLVGYDYVV